jgi:hypothetical protein
LIGSIAANSLNEVAADAFFGLLLETRWAEFKVRQRYIQYKLEDIARHNAQDHRREFRLGQTGQHPSAAGRRRRLSNFESESAVNGWPIDAALGGQREDLALTSEGKQAYI